MGLSRLGFKVTTSPLMGKGTGRANGVPCSCDSYSVQACMDTYTRMCINYRPWHKRTQWEWFSPEGNFPVRLHFLTSRVLRLSQTFLGKNSWKEAVYAETAGLIRIVVQRRLERCGFGGKCFILGCSSTLEQPFLIHLCIELPLPPCDKWYIYIIYYIHNI